MRRRLAGLALALYPLAFRRRYGQEMRALLDETPPGVHTVLDLLRGALAAHLRPPAGLGGVVVLAGALPLIVLALNHARRERSLRMLVSLPIVAVAVFTGLTGILILVAHSQHSQHPSTAGGIAFIAWGLAGLACGAVCVLASRRALFAIPVLRGWLLAAFACGALVTAAMVAITIATAIYTIALSVDASALAGEPNGPLQATSVSISLIEQLIVMVIAGGLAAITTRRGWRALSQPDAAQS